jgi:hypothetical protein
MCGRVTVMPMVKNRAGKHKSQRAEFEINIRMVRKSMKAKKDRVGDQRHIRKSQQKYGNELDAIPEQLVERVKPDIRQPVHSLMGVWRHI